MLNIAICDDDALHGRHTAAQISGLDGFAAAKLSLFTSADNLIYAITEDNYAVDIAVLDIQMESMDGIELAKRINEIAPECQIIFLSGHIEYASKVYDAEHVFFVLKSQSETYLKSALEKAVHRRESAKANYIVITNGANAQRMPWDKPCGNAAGRIYTEKRRAYTHKPQPFAPCEGNFPIRGAAVWRLKRRGAV